MLPPSATSGESEDKPRTNDDSKPFRVAAVECSSAFPEVVAYVAKVFGIPESAIVRPKLSTVPSTAPRAEPSSVPNPLRQHRERIEEGEWSDRRRRRKDKTEGSAADDGILEPSAASTSVVIGEPISRSESTGIKKELNVEHAAVPSAEEKEIVIGLVRVYAGSLKKGSRLFLFGPRHTPGDEPPVVTVSDVLLMMGRDFIPVDEVPAGNVCCISGLGDVVCKAATLSTSRVCPPLAQSVFQASPIMRVAIEPVSPLDLDRFLTALRYLQATDTALEVVLAATGNHVLLVQGEVHLQRCLTDIDNITGGIKLRVSSPIVPFRETLVPHEVGPSSQPILFGGGFDDEDAAEKGKKKKLWPDPPLHPLFIRPVVEHSEDPETAKEDDSKFDPVFWTPNGRLGFVIRASPLPPSITRFLVANQDKLREFLATGNLDSGVPRWVLISLLLSFDPQDPIVLSTTSRIPFLLT